MCEEMGAEQCKEEKQYGSSDKVKDEKEGERRERIEERKEEEHCSDTEQGSKNVNVCQEKIEIEKTETYEGSITTDDTKRHKCESHGKVKLEKQVDDSKSSR